MWILVAINRWQKAPKAYVVLWFYIIFPDVAIKSTNTSLSNFLYYVMIGNVPWDTGLWFGVHQEQWTSLLEWKKMFSGIAKSEKEIYRIFPLDLILRCGSISLTDLFPYSFCKSGILCFCRSIALPFPRDMTPWSSVVHICRRVLIVLNYVLLSV